MPLRQLSELLDSNKIRYTSIKHSPAYTASETAQSAHVSGKEFAKAVIVKLDGKMAMVVLPANSQMNFELVRNKAKAKECQLASESEFREKFPGCELGAMPPFGNLFGMDVYLSKGLQDCDKIVFNAGSHSELIRMSINDFLNLVKPRLLAAA